MAGDITYLSANDSSKNVLAEKYIGKMRYNNLFALENFKRGDNRLYELEYRLSDGKQSYDIIDNDIIEEIEKILQENSPITSLEQLAYNETESALEWIDKQNDKYHDIDIHFILRTSHDY